MDKRAFSVAVIFVMLANVSTHAQSEKDECKGDFLSVMKGEPYHFATSSRVETFRDYKMVVSCVQNFTNGFFRFHWFAPGLLALFAGPGANKSYRPTGLAQTLMPAPGCYSYGNLSSIGRAFFYATPFDLMTLEREENNCPRRFGENVNNVILASSHPSEIMGKQNVPRSITYEQDATIVLGDPTLLENILRIKFMIDFVNDGNAQTVTISYKVISKNSDRSLALSSLVMRPIADGAATDNFIQIFESVYGHQHHLKPKSDIKLTYVGTAIQRFDSLRLGIFSANGELMSTIWVPALLP